MAALVESCTEPVTEPLVTWPNALELKITSIEKTARRAARFGCPKASIIICIPSPALGLELRELYIEIGLWGTAQFALLFTSDDMCAVLTGRPR